SALAVAGQYHVGPIGQGTGKARLALCALCRRLSGPGQKSSGSATGHAEHQQVCGRPTQAGGQSPEEQGRASVRMYVSRISNSPGKNCVDGKGPATVQGTHTGNYQPQPRGFCLLHAAGATAIRGGVDELFWSQPGLSSHPGAGPVGATACA